MTEDDYGKGEGTDMEHKRRQGKKQIALITGASSGLGREFVRQIASRYPGLDEIWVVARRKDRLEQLAQECDKIRPVCLDLLSDDGRKAWKKRLEEESPAIRILVLAAGCGYYGRMEEQEYPKAMEMISLNDEALTWSLMTALPYIPEKSRIIALASGAAYLPQPGFCIYAATKAYVRHLCLALNQELKKRKVTVTAVCPGPVDTEFFEHAGQTVAPWKKRFLAEADAVVQKALYDASRGRRESVYGYSMKLVKAGAKFLPWRPILWMMEKFTE